MPGMKRTRLALAAAGSALALAGTLGAGAGQASAAPVTALAWGGCVSGDICVYSGLNGTGDVCAWDGDDNNWRAGAVVCSWSDNKRVMSIWNRGTGGAGSYRHVKFYHSADYKNYYACAAQNFQGNTNGTAGAWLQSHRWVTSC
ncbi:peptidase inhibitor family I36 protein [Streptomyces sp. NPDC054863]